jgi:hypothetical protein
MGEIFGQKACSGVVALLDKVPNTSLKFFVYWTQDSTLGALGRSGICLENYSLRYVSSHFPHFYFKKN